MENTTSLIDATAEEAIAIWEQEKSGKENQTSLPQQASSPRPTPVRPEIWIDLNGCDEGFHMFGRDEAGHWQAWHSDESLCRPIEFNLKAEAA